MTRKNWIAVASAEHARMGRDATLCAPTLATSCAALHLAGRRSPEASFLSPVQTCSSRFGAAGSSPEGAELAWGGPARRSGYMQVGHGKLAPLKRVSPGDLVAYYSPTVVFGAKDAFQSFVSLGIVQAGEPYAFDMGKGFVPFRRDVIYVKSKEAPILPLLDAFDFVEDRQRWGYKFRFGLFEVNDHDMCLIARAMRVDLTSLGLG